MELEIKRKIVHALGVFSILLIQFFGRYNAALIMLAATCTGLLIAEYRKNKEKYKLIKIKPLDDFENLIEDEFKTVERKNVLPFKGAIEFGLGCFLATILFKETIAIAAITILALADSSSTLVGYYFGKYKLPVNKKKTWEGSITFFIISIFILTFFRIPAFAFIIAALATITEMNPYVDDNLVIPLVVGISMTFL